ncbi:TPA: hypothetical protein ACGCAJ_004705 [Serratia marcescens]
MPKRKVVQTVVIYRDGQRLKPAIGTIFDFKQNELDDITSINPDAVTRPIVEVDVENLQAQADAKAQAEKDAADAKAKADADAKAAGAKGKGKDAKKDDAKPEDDEV